MRPGRLPIRLGGSQRLQSTKCHEQLSQMFEAAHRTQMEWAVTPISQRKEVLARFGELLKSKCGNLAEVLTAEMGKPLAHAKGEISATPSRVRYFLDHVEEVIQDEVIRKNEKREERLTWEPLGVVASISAWNYPYFVGSNVYVPALLTGNAVLYKPSEHTLNSGKKMEEILLEAGLPEGVFQCVSGGPDVGEALLSMPIDGLFFTGSVRTGMAIKRALVHRNIPLQLELGGKDSAYVMSDMKESDGNIAHVHRAAESLGDGAMFNSGQGCCSVERIYVHEDVYEPFVEKLVEVVSNFRVGSPWEEGVQLGPLCLSTAPSVLERQITDAVADGARVLCGGKRMEGNFFQPTVLVDVHQGMRVMQEESFGPIVCVSKVASDQEAIDMMNDSEYGLTAAVYGLDRDRAVGVLKQVQTGTAYFNCCDWVSAYLPWTGQKCSGVGGTCGESGIRAFVKPKAFHFRQP